MMCVCVSDEACVDRKRERRGNRVTEREREREREELGVRRTTRRGRRWWWLSRQPGASNHTGTSSRTHQLTQRSQLVSGGPRRQHQQQPSPSSASASRHRHGPMHCARTTRLCRCGSRVYLSPPPPLSQPCTTVVPSFLVPPFFILFLCVSPRLLASFTLCARVFVHVYALAAVGRRPRPRRRRRFRRGILVNDSGANIARGNIKNVRWGQRRPGRSMEREEMLASAATDCRAAT